MGCCLSRGDEERNRQSDGGATLSEEETVKEVVVEAPPILLKTPNPIEITKEKPFDNRECKAGSEPGVVIVNDPKLQKKPIEEKEIVVSEVSETCSYSESFSSTKAPEKNDDGDEGEVNQRPRLRKRQCHGGSTRRAPVRKLPAPSPEKRVQAAPSRTVRGQRRNVEAEKSFKRDAGEISGRKKRLPAANSETNTRREVSETVKSDSFSVKSDAGKCCDDVVLGDTEAESLENPVVSLECFIFL